MFNKLFIVIFLVCLPTFSLAQTTTYSSGSGKMVVAMNIALVGPGASAELADAWEKAIKDAWQEGLKKNSCYDIDFQVNIEFTGDTDAITGIDAIGTNTDQWLINTFGGYKDEYSGSDVWYVPNIANGQYYRSWTEADSYNDDLVGAVASNAGAAVAIHEAGHLLGMDDHYIEATGQPEQGWEDNIMAETDYSQFNMIWDDETYADKTDSRNFEEMFSTIEKELEMDLQPCLKLTIENMQLDFLSYPFDEKYTANADININPMYPLFDSTTSIKKDTYDLTGSGTGHAEWQEVRRTPETFFDKFEVTNNDFSIGVSGYNEGDIYKITLEPKDNYIAVAGGRQYDQGSNLDIFFENATGFCTKDQSTGIELQLDTKQLFKGLECPFTVNYSADSITVNGDYMIKIESIQG